MRNKESKVVTAVVIVSSLALLSLSVFGYFRLSDTVEAGNRNVKLLQNHIMSNARSGYRAVVNIATGEMITDAMVEYSTTIPSDLDQTLFMTEDDIGKIATVDIPAGMPVMGNMISAQLASDYKERECTFIWLNTNLKNNDFVDVRILFQNGEDYIVAAKKPIKNANIPANDVCLWLTEEEIQLLDAAIVDANLHNARIYVTRYVRPSVQEASIPTYEPNSAVVEVMKNDPNIVAASARALSLSARAAMEKRLQLFEKAYPTFDLNMEAETMGGDYDTVGEVDEVDDQSVKSTDGDEATANDDNTSDNGTQSATNSTSGDGTQATGVTETTTGTTPAGSTEEVEYVD